MHRLGEDLFAHSKARRRATGGLFRALPGSPGEHLLQIVWAGAVVGILQSLFWVTAPKVLVTALYVLLGWAGVRSIGQLRNTGVLLVACGGLSYTVGGVCMLCAAHDWYGQMLKL